MMDKQKGSAMLTVLCALMIILLLSLSLHYAVRVLSVTQQNSYSRMQARTMAVSCLNTLESELLCTGAKEVNSAENAAGEAEEKTQAEEEKGEIEEAEETEGEYAEKVEETGNGLSAYLEERIKPWEGKRIFQADIPEGIWPQEAGKLTIGLSWTDAGEERQDRVSGSDAKRQESAVLLVEVHAVCGRQSCTISRKYTKNADGGWEKWKEE